MTSTSKQDGEKQPANPIIKAEINLDTCLESLPCQHFVTLTYADGTMKRPFMTIAKAKKLYEWLGQAPPPGRTVSGCWP